MSKNRLIALDGLRGFAALSVLISHIGINLGPIIAVPAYNFLFRLISSGTSAVQLFFVLSGFLMAYLYPQIKNNFYFISRRYLRIMPLYAVVVIYLWWVTFQDYSNIFVCLFILFGLAFIVNLAWQYLRFGRWLFYAFLVFQAIYLLFSLTLMPNLVTPESALNNFQKQILHMLANLTQTMYLQKRLVVLNGVFWSLVPEMIFYLIYPFTFVPLIAWLNRKKSWVSVTIGAFLIKFLFDLDMASREFYSLHGIYICRSVGFMIGIIIGRIYLNRQKTWEWLEKTIKKSWVNLFILLLFLAALGLEWPDRIYQIRKYVSWHYLILSLIFGLTMMAGLIEKTIINRIFCNKFLVFLGMISYSLYLIHPNIVRLTEFWPIWKQLNWLTIGWINFLKIIICSGVCIFVAWGLYWLIERLYFVYKTKNTRIKTDRFSSLPAIAIIAAVIFIFAGDYSPLSLLSKQPLELIQDNPYKFSFYADQPNLSVIWLSLDYARDPNILRTAITKNVQLVFKLSDNNDNLIFTSERSPLQLEGQPQYPFGFPAIAESKGKLYKVELGLINSEPSDEIYINKIKGIVTQYAAEKSFNPKFIIWIIYKRLLFTASRLIN